MYNGIAPPLVSAGQFWRGQDVPKTIAGYQNHTPNQPCPSEYTSRFVSGKAPHLADATWPAEDTPGAPNLALAGECFQRFGHARVSTASSRTCATHPDLQQHSRPLKAAPYKHYLGFSRAPKSRAFLFVTDVCAHLFHRCTPRAPIQTNKPTLIIAIIIIIINIIIIIIIIILTSH